MAEFLIAHLYPELMDMQGDRGNLICLEKRIEWYGHKATIINYNLETNINFSQFDMLFMGGGSEREQDIVCQDLFNKKEALSKSIESGLPILFVSAAYQLLGTSYGTSAGNLKSGLDLFDFYTEIEDDRLIGNILTTTTIDKETINIIGFENHKGRTYFSDQNLQPFATVVKGYGNNGQDNTEGLKYNNLIGTYLHGPILPRNPILADFFINKMFIAKNIKSVITLSDDLEEFAYDQIYEQIST
ncbi:MAG TPA: glutamine amidotransferase [Syntrophomonadaceae bacterium]|nr:glutamine amidotransferase [Syntrophomonadaceae bacterium]